MPKHDYVCTNDDCGNYEFDAIIKYGDPLFCPECHTLMKITYEFWEDVALADHGRSANERTDHNGFVKNWGSDDDPLCKLEVLGGGLKDAGVVTFTPDQQAAFRQRILMEGSTPQIRKDILSTRKENIKQARAEAKKKAESR